MLSQRMGIRLFNLFIWLEAFEVWGMLLFWSRKKGLAKANKTSCDQTDMSGEEIKRQGWSTNNSKQGDAANKC